MKRVIVFAVFFLLAVSTRAAELHGAWTATTDSNKPGRIHLELSYAGRNHFGESFDTAQFSALTNAQIDGSSQTPVTFELRREAGTVAFHGFFEKGEGAGHFNFTPSSSYLSAIESMGVQPGKRRATDEQLLSLAMLDVSTDFIRTMRAEGYDVTLDEYTAMRIFGVTPQVLSDYRRLGYDKIPYEKLIAMRVHRVTPEYIEQMRRAGFASLSLNDLVTSSIHRVTPEFLSEMRAAGYGSLQFDDAVKFRIHRVTPEIIRELRDLGYDKLTPDQLVAMSIHRVTPEYIRDLKNAGYSDVPVDKLVSMRIHGIDAEMVKKMR